MTNVQQDTSILVYTRKPKNDYTESLSNSIHFAIGEGVSDLLPLNQNYGIVFALATVDEYNVIHEKGLKNPYLFNTEGGSFGIIATRVDKNGNEDMEGKGHILLWTSEDMITFHYHGLVKLHEELFIKEAVCEFKEDSRIYEIRWQDNEGNTYLNTMQDITQVSSCSQPVAAEGFAKEVPAANLSDILPGNIIHVNKETGDAIKRHWLPVHNTQVCVPDQVSVTSPEQLQVVKATAVYSDGSTVDKQVQWDYSGIDFSVPGNHTVKGKVIQKAYPFPLAKGYADPVILPWENRYYYLATNDNVNDIGIFVREGDTISELFSPGFKESIILNVDEERDFIQTFWAPEFHKIGDDLYILFAVGGKLWAPQCHMMKLKKGGNIMKAEDWETPIRVKRADGTYLTQDGITLDMTYFKANGTSCVVWSYRKGIGTPFDTGSMIYIATIDEKNPTVLTSEPVLLTRPLYGWENIQGTINNEGPYALVTEDMVYVTYSGGAANGYTYALGLLSIPSNGDLLDAKAWKKAGAPVLSYYSIDGVYGPGHNSFFRDYDGSVMLMYHGEVKLAAQDIRCTGMHRVHFKKDGTPAFNLSKDRDLNPALAEVKLMVVIE